MAERGNVTIFGDIADDYDALVLSNEKLLDGFVEQNGYSLGSMVFASSALALMKFAKVFVDVGRLGNGVFVEGGWKGAGQDALRALNLAGGAGAALSRGGKLLRMTQVGNSCAWTAQANALTLAGQKYFVTARQLAAQAGVTAQQWKSILLLGRGADDYAKMLGLLTKLKIPHQTLTAAGNSLSGALNAVRAAPAGVVTFSIRFGPGGAQGHRLYATFSRTGGLVIRDPNFRMTVYRSLADLQKAFGPNVSLSTSPMIFIKDAVLMQAAHLAEGLGGLSMLAWHVIPSVEVRAPDAETAAQALDVRDRIDAIRKSAKMRHHDVVVDDTLWTLSGVYYGSERKWPVIHAANTKVIGANPHLIRPGQRLGIPPLPRLRQTGAAATGGGPALMTGAGV